MKANQNINREDEFRALFAEHITRKGSDELFRWIDTRTDFFDAPASTRFHANYDGGLVDHSVNVYDVLRADPRAADYSDETIAIVALLHDLCKVNHYTPTGRGYVTDDDFPLGHGEKSLYYVARYMDLKPQEALAIRWHMGAYDDAGKCQDLDAAMSKCPLCVLLHQADVWASKYVDARGD